jgi:hypothetical protein
VHPLRTTLTLALTLPLLTGCSGLLRPMLHVDVDPVVELRTVAAAPPPDLVRPCRSPGALAKGALSAGAVERAWAKDRVSLAVCRDRHGALVHFYAERDAGLAGQPSK